MQPKPKIAIGLSIDMHLAERLREHCVLKGAKVNTYITHLIETALLSPVKQLELEVARYAELHAAACKALKIVREIEQEKIKHEAQEIAEELTKTL